MLAINVIGTHNPQWANSCYPFSYVDPQRLPPYIYIKDQTNKENLVRPKKKKILKIKKENLDLTKIEKTLRSSQKKRDSTTIYEIPMLKLWF